jgi:hypothetical protein
MGAGEQDVHHARAGAAGKETLDRRRHDLRLGASRAVRLDQRPETVLDDVHGFAHLDKLFFTLHRSRHIEMEIEGQPFAASLHHLAVVADRQHVVQAIDADALPLLLVGFLAHPAAGQVRPDLVAHPGLLLVADPAGLARENKRRFAFQGEYDIHVAVHDLEAGHVENRAFETGVLITAHDQGIQLGAFHSGTDVGKATRDFFLTWQFSP